MPSPIEKLFEKNEIDVKHLRPGDILLLRPKKLLPESSMQMLRRQSERACAQYGLKVMVIGENFDVAIARYEVAEELKELISSE